MIIIDKPIDELVMYARNPRKNDQAVAAVTASIKEFGFKQPIVIDKDNVIVAGHTRLKAAQKLGLKTVPCLMADDLSEQQIKAYRILDNKIAEKAEWAGDLLRVELEDLPDFNFEPFEVEFDAEQEHDIEREQTLRSAWEVIVECSDEDHQQHVYNRLIDEGLQCRVLTY